MRDNICIVILVGGLSSRMGGGIKSLVEFNNVSIFKRILNRINHQANLIIINSNDDKNVFQNFNLTIIKDRFKDRLGPLAGIHSALYWIKKNNPHIKWLISIPCDTPFIPKNLTSKLVSKAINSEKKIILAKSNDKVHPVIGLWDTDLFNDLEKNLQDNVRKIMSWVSKHPYEVEDFTNKDFDPFFNINFMIDLKEAKFIENKYIL